MWDIRPPLKQLHKNSRLEWTRNYMKINFKHVLFTDEMHATPDEPDGWSKVWAHEQASRPQHLRRQQDGGGIMR